ncbi:MAG: 50S ribosomal protein L11 methyltransferase [Verrucomicrobiota bacterium]
MISTAIFLIYAAGFFLLAWMLWIVWQMRKKGAPFWPSSRRKVKEMLELAQVREGDCVADLGSGDGRLILAAAEAGAKKATGYEIDPFWLNVAVEKRKRSPHMEKIQFVKQSFWDANLGECNVVFLYQGKHIMRDLNKKLKKELPRGARVISNRHTFPEWTPTKTSSGVHLYIL